MLPPGVPRDARLSNKRSSIMQEIVDIINKEDPEAKPSPPTESESNRVSPASSKTSRLSSLGDLLSGRSKQAHSSTSLLLNKTKTEDSHASTEHVESPSSSRPRTSDTPRTPDTPYTPYSPLGDQSLNPVTPESVHSGSSSGLGLGNLSHIYSNAVRVQPPPGFASKLVKRSRDRLSNLDKLRGIRRFHTAGDSQTQSPSSPETSPVLTKKISKKFGALQQADLNGSTKYLNRRASSPTSFDHSEKQSSPLASKSAPLLPLDFEEIDLEQAVLDAGAGKSPQSTQSQSSDLSSRPLTALRGRIPTTPLPVQKWRKSVANFTSAKVPTSISAGELLKPKRDIGPIKDLESLNSEHARVAPYDDDSDGGSIDFSGAAWNRILNVVSPDPQTRAHIRKKARRSGAWAVPSKKVARRLSVDTSVPANARVTKKPEPYEERVIELTAGSVGGVGSVGGEDDSEAGKAKDDAEGEDERNDMAHSPQVTAATEGKTTSASASPLPISSAVVTEPAKPVVSSAIDLYSKYCNQSDVPGPAVNDCSSGTTIIEPANDSTQHRDKGKGPAVESTSPSISPFTPSSLWTKIPGLTYHGASEVTRKFIYDAGTEPGKVVHDGHTIAYSPSQGLTYIAGSPDSDSVGAIKDVHPAFRGVKEPGNPKDTTMSSEVNIDDVINQWAATASTTAVTTSDKPKGLGLDFPPSKHASTGSSETEADHAAARPQEKTAIQSILEAIDEAAEEAAGGGADNSMECPDITPPAPLTSLTPLTPLTTKALQKVPIVARPSIRTGIQAPSASQASLVSVFENNSVSSADTVTPEKFKISLKKKTSAYNSFSRSLNNLHKASFGNLRAKAAVAQQDETSKRRGSLTDEENTRLRARFSLPPIQLHTGGDLTSHPSHPFAWQTAKLSCAAHEHQCPICSASCCVHEALQFKLAQGTAGLAVGGKVGTMAKVRELEGATGGKAVESFGTFVKCTSCAKVVCTACAGRCGEVLCGDLVCKHCSADPWENCAVHQVPQ